MNTNINHNPHINTDYDPQTDRHTGSWTCSCGAVGASSGDFASEESARIGNRVNWSSHVGTAQTEE